MTTSISTLAANVQSRLEEVPGSAGAWWSLQYEIYSGIVEAMNDLLLLVGRPTQVVNLPFTLTPNTPWQTVPKGILLITDIQGFASPLYKVNLYDLDFLMTSWGPDWQQDVGPVSYRWAPVGFGMFVVHPAPAAPQTVNITAIQYPTTDVWPYTGSETVCFQDEFFVALELYASAYSRVKEMGGEHAEGVKLLEQYFQIAKRLSTIEDKRDPLLFTMGFGASNNISPTTMR